MREVERLGIYRDFSGISSGMPVPPFVTITTRYSCHGIFNNCNATIVYRSHMIEVLARHDHQTDNFNFTPKPFVQCQ